MIKKLAVITAVLIVHSVQVKVQAETRVTEATVIVEAEKISSQEIEASRSAVVFDESVIKLKRPSNVADILRDIPGIEVVRQGSVGQTTTVFIRGSKSESTLVLIDGAVANDIMSPSSGYDFSNLSPNNIARVEVYRGPQSVRFGAGALGGVINIVTKEGSGPLGVDYLVEGGTYETYRVALGVNGSSGDFNYSLGTEGFKSAGFSAAGSSSSLEKDAASVASVSSKLGYKINSVTKIEATLRYADAEVDLDRGGDASSDDSNYDSEADQLIGGFSGQTRFLDDRLLSILGYYFSQNERESENLVDAVSTDFSSDYFESENYKIETSHEVSLGEEHKIRLDLQWREEKGKGDSSFNGTDSSIGEKHQGVLGEALTYVYESETWFGDLGARSDQSTEVDDIFSHRISFGRFLSSDKRAKIYGTYGTGFKLPSLYQLYSSFGNPALEHEYSRTGEITLEGSLTQKDLSSITIFNNIYRDLIDYDNSTNKYLNVAKANSRGIELQSRLQLQKDLEIKVSFNYLDSEDEATGLSLVRRPRRSFSLETDYKMAVLTSYLKYSYRGKRPDIDPVTFGRITNSSYGVLDLGTEYTINDELSIKARLENVFDKKYEEVAGYGTPRLSFYAGLTGRL